VGSVLVEPRPVTVLARWHEVSLISTAASWLRLSSLHQFALESTILDPATISEQSENQGGMLQVSIQVRTLSESPLSSWAMSSTFVLYNSTCTWWQYSTVFAKLLRLK
jgi:hypothetical protein